MFCDFVLCFVIVLSFVIPSNVIKLLSCESRSLSRMEFEFSLCFVFVRGKLSYRFFVRFQLKKMEAQKTGDIFRVANGFGYSVKQQNILTNRNPRAAMLATYHSNLILLNFSIA